MTSPFQPAAWPSDPTLPSGPPAGYVGPALQPQGATFEPPMTPAEIQAMAQRFIEMILRQIIQAIQGFFLPGSGDTFQQLVDLFAQFVGPEWFSGDWQDLIDGLFNTATGGSGSGNLFSQLLGVLPRLLNISDPLNAGNVFGNFRPNLLGTLPAGAVQDTIQNMLMNPLFQGLQSIFGGGSQGWTWQNILGHSGTGLAQVIADGATNELLSNEVHVNPGQNVDLSTWVKWTGLTYTGTNPISFGVTEYNRNPITQILDEGLSIDLASFLSPASSSSNAPENNFLQLAGTYTVPPAATRVVDAIRMRLRIGGNATAGTVQWDDGRKVLTDLVGDNVVPGIGLTLDSIVNALFGLDLTGWLHLDSFEALTSQNNAVINSGSEISALWAYLSLLPPPGGGAPPGVAYTDNFERASSSTLGANWDETVSGNGSWALDGHYAYFGSVYPNGITETKNRYTVGETNTDYQTVSVNLGSAPTKFFFSFAGRNDVLGRLNTAETSYIRFRVGADGAWSLSKVISSTVTTMDSGTTTAPGAGTILTLICGDKATTTLRHYTAKINNSVLTSGTFSDTTSNTGAGFRYAGFGGRAENDLFNSPQWIPGKVNDWAGRDT